MEPDELQQCCPAAVADVRGCACPGPLMETKKVIDTIKVGEILEVRSSDYISKHDIAVWASMTGHEFLGVVGVDEGYDRIFLRRTK